MRINNRSCLLLMSLLVPNLFYACSESGLTGTANAKKDTSKKTNGGEVNKGNDPEGGPEIIEDGIGDSTNDPTTCLFAVSGSHFGYSIGSRDPDKYNSKFPQTSSGGPTKHLEKFDTTGGVYLQAAAVAYEYQKGGKEIDQAVIDSFDSIAIPPGLEVEIRSGNGKVLFKGQGPFMAFDSFNNPGSGAASYLKGFASNVTAEHWMKKYLESKNFSIEAVALSPYPFDAGNKENAHFVKVTKLKGVKCDSY